MDIQEVIDKKRTFTAIEREEAIQYLMWYTCCYHKEQLEKLSDETIAKMVEDTRFLVNKGDR